MYFELGLMNEHNGWVRRRARKRAVGLLASMRPLILALFLCGPLIAQQAEFDVASIRPAGNGIAKPEMEFTPGGGVRATNVTLKMRRICQTSSLMDRGARRKRSRWCGRCGNSLG